MSLSTVDVKYYYILGRHYIFGNLHKINPLSTVREKKINSRFSKNLLGEVKIVRKKSKKKRLEVVLISATVQTAKFYKVYIEN